MALAGLLALVAVATPASLLRWAGPARGTPSSCSASPAVAPAQGAGRARRRGASWPVRTLPAQLPGRALRVPILMYHRIDLLRPSLPAITRALTVEPTAFAAQMRALARSGHHTITQAQLFDALEHGRPLPSRPVLVTFDDGYRDVLHYAAPVLHRLGQHATMYVVSGRVSGPDPSFLRWRDLRALERLGVEIGSHTSSHANLPRLSASAAASELGGSRHLLERHLGHPVQWLAYPYGGYDARVVALARAAGYVLAVTTRGGVTQRAARPLELERLEVLGTTTTAGLLRLLATP